MLDPLDFENRPQRQKELRSVSRKRFIAGCVMTLESLSVALWKPLTLALFIAALWLFQIPALLGSIASVIVAFAFIGGIATLLYQNRTLFTRPDANDIDRRLERDSDVMHRPLNAIDDTLANPKSTNRPLWQGRIDGVFTRLKRLTFIKPSPLIAKQDPYGLRLIALLLFIAGLFVSGHGWDERLTRGLFPLNIHSETTSKNNVALWVTPPDYTSQKQIIVAADTDEDTDIAVAQDSIFKITVHGGWGKPRLKIGGQSYDFSDAGDDSYIAELTAPNATTINISQFLIPRASWTYHLTPDAAPTITLHETAPQVQPDGALRFPMTVHDDYGVKTLTMDMQLESDLVLEPPLGEAASETRSISSPADKDFAFSPHYDLTSHYWAGLPALFTFTATDHLGQSASTTPIQMKLPERIFRHPVAKRLIAMRKDLIWNPNGPYIEMARDIEDIQLRPGAYQGDLIVFLTLRAAASRLAYTYEPSTEAARAIIDLLWDTALRIEDGNLSLAARDLRDAQNALENAMRDESTSEAEIAQLMESLRSAMAEYFTALQEELQKRIAEGQDIPTASPEMLSQMINPDALANFLDQLQHEMTNGDKNKAQDMLSQLQRMMDMMNSSMNAEMPKDMQMMQEGVSELEQLIENQEKLLQHTRQRIAIWKNLRTFQRSYGQTLPFNKKTLRELGIEDLPPPPSVQPIPQDLPDINTSDMREEQEGLRLILGQLMIESNEALDSIPEGMGKAEREMASSATQFEKNAPNSSIPHQELAIKYLKEAQESLAQQFAQRMQQMGMMFSGGPGSGGRRDPLGRPYEGQDGQNEILPGAQVEIPDERERSRALEILRELRRRSSEHSRPREERDYYRRLLRQF